MALLKILFPVLLIAIGNFRAQATSGNSDIDHKMFYDKMKGHVDTVLKNEHGSAAIQAKLTNIIDVVSNEKAGETINKILSSMLVTMEDNNGHNSLIVLTDSLVDFFTDRQLQPALKEILGGLERLGMFDKTPIILDIITNLTVILRTVPNVEKFLLSTGNAVRYVIDKEDSCTAIVKGFKNLTKVFRTSRLGIVKNNVKGFRHRF